jgi:hypothetical protein
MAAGFDPEQHILGTFTLLGERTLSSLPSDLSDLEESSASLYSLMLNKSNSKEKVTIVLLPPSASTSMQAITTRSRARAQYSKL